MSSNINNTRKKRILGSAAAIAGLGIAVAAFSPIAGANFSDSKTGRIDATASTLTIGLSDDKNNVNTFDLDYDNLTPGQPMSRTIYVKNNGSIPAATKVGYPLTEGVTPVGVNLDELKVGVNGTQDMVPASQFNTINLGVLQPGETKSVNLTMLLQTNDNNWQGKTFGATLTVTGEQVG